METEKPASTSRTRKLILGFLRKAGGFIVMAFVLGWAMDFSATRNDPEKPAGFWWGALHGALMPATLPSLFLGNDPTIYAPHNVGRMYKLGYTCGVNGCGLLFFGLLFWSPPKKIPAPEGAGKEDET